MKNKIAIVILLSLGVWHVSSSGYMLAKAELSQFLIKQAWQKSVVDKKNHKPWSWADTYPVLEMDIPRLKQQSYILEGSSGRNLAFSATHMPQSGKLGEHKTMVLSGHRDSHFGYLKKLLIGDKIIIKDLDNTLTYVVEKTLIVDSKKQKLNILNKQELLLTTCYPFDSITTGGSLRFVVYAKPIS